MRGGGGIKLPPLMMTTMMAKSGSRRFSHGLELVDALLRVALSDLPQRFVLVSARFHVLGVEHVVLRLLGFVSGLGQL